MLHSELLTVLAMVVGGIAAATITFSLLKLVFKLIVGLVKLAATVVTTYLIVVLLHKHHEEIVAAATDLISRFH